MSKYGIRHSSFVLRHLLLRFVVPSLPALFAALMCWPVLAAAQVEVIPTHGRNIWRLAVARLETRQPGWDIVGSTFDNRICAFDSHGKHLWDAAVGGFVFDLGSLGSQRRRAMTKSSPVRLMAWCMCWTGMGSDFGHMISARRPGKWPIVRLDGKAAQRAGRRRCRGKWYRSLRRGNCLKKWESSALSECCVPATSTATGQMKWPRCRLRGQAKDVQFFRGPQLKPYPAKLPVQMIEYDPVTRRSVRPKDRKPGQKAWDGSGLIACNATVADVDGNGAAELIYGPGAVSVKSGVQWIANLPDPPPAKSYDYFYRMRMMAVGNLSDSPGAEIAVLEGPDIQLCDSHGKLLSKAKSPCGFTDIVYVPGNPYGAVMLGSSPNGDDNLYRLTFQPGWEKP